jgi:exosortase/archaeosortase family protein
MAAGFVAVAVLFAQSQDALREITRPIVLIILKAIGTQAEDRGDIIAIGHLEIPWTRDCAGINLLIIMLALAVWVNREEPSVRKFWLRVAAMAPAALAANVLRVLSLMGYRMIAYPAVESPQTHYFLGFIWMVPFITLITPRMGRSISRAFLETLHAAAVVALLTPITGMPNGTMVAIAAVLALSQSRFREDWWQTRVVLTALWILAGGLVAWMNMESFWLPWLLCCPLLLDFRWLLTPTGGLLMLTTHSMFAMQPWAPYIGWIGIGFAIRGWIQRSATTTEIPSPTLTPAQTQTRWILAPVSAVCFLAPFLASTLLSVGHTRWTPPTAVESRALGNQGYEIRLPDQPDHIALVCYGPEGKDRHHNVQVCLKYRGTQVTPCPEEKMVYTDGEHWLREFFIHDGALLADYPSYLKSTFAPGAEPGIHLIFVSPMHLGKSDDFSRQSDRLAAAFYEISLRTMHKP